jgi:membrane-associated phospholipid phosphatase
MPSSAVQSARDYNRGLSAPMRWSHIAVAAAGVPIRRLLRWAGEDQRRTWAQPMLLALLGMALFPLDGPITAGSAWVSGRIGGDVRRQLVWFQEYGQFGSIALAALLMWLLDPERRARLLDWIAGMAIAAAIVFPMKMLIGRPRPRLGDPGSILGPFGAYPLGPGRGVRHAWEVWGGISSDLWSMPSSHTAYAVVMSVFLAAVYPRVRGLVYLLAVAVGVCRVLFGAHYASDVVVGAGAGLLAGRAGLAWARRRRADSPEID